MKRFLNVAIMVAVTLSMVSCAKSYQQGPIKKSDMAATMPAGTIPENLDLYVLHVSDANGVDLTKNYQIRLTGIGMMNDHDLVTDFRVVISVDRVTKAAQVYISILYPQYANPYVITLAGTVTTNVNNGFLLFQAKDAYSTDIVSIGSIGATAMVSITDGKFGSFVQNTVFQVNPADSY